MRRGGNPRNGAQGGASAIFTDRDWEQLDSLCEMQCTEEEILSFFKLSNKTLSKLIKQKYNESFLEFYAKRREGGKASLRRKQWLLADKFPAMAIFLGKQILGQTDRVETVNQNFNSPDELTITLVRADENQYRDTGAVR